MQRTKIEWATHVWNPVTGCTPVSAGCRNCYAARMAKRLAGRAGYDAAEPFKVTVHEERFDEPGRWKKPGRVFVCSMGDLFHEDVDDACIRAVYETMMRYQQHTYLVLTKRAERMQKFLAQQSPAKRAPFNVWHGVTAEDQDTANERIPYLLNTPSFVRFVSVEPMLERAYILRLLETVSIQWVICGGETGPGARMHDLSNMLDLHQQCKTRSIPFFFKQLGDGGERMSATFVSTCEKIIDEMINTREFPLVYRHQPIV